MFAASVIVLLLNTAGPANKATPLGFFKAAVREKDAAKKGDLVIRGVEAFDVSNENNLGELDRVFPLYLGLLGADLPIPTALYLADAAMVFPLTAETRSLAVEAFEAYRDKIKGTKEDDPPKSDAGAFTGLGPFVKASSVLQQNIDALKSGELPERKKGKK